LSRKILLADDSVTAQNMGRKILADAGYDVVTVNNGSAALKRIAEIKPDLIVLDVYMPGYSGLEVCQRLKDSAETEHIPVLLTVGKLEPFKPEEARRVRADAHIVKPFEASELLTAITRLEDRMVPQHDGTRFSASVPGVERFGGESNTDPDTGWKSRLRFPSKKKKEEPETEAEDAAAGATFRDFRKAKGKTGASGVFAVKAPAPPGQEPGLVPDIPRDITPDELDALSALAARLDGPIPAAEDIAPLAEKMGPAVPVAHAAAKTEVARTEVAKTEPEVPAAAAETKTEVEPSAPAVEPAAAAVAAPALAVEVPALAVEAKSEVEIPVEHTEPASEVAAAEMHRHETEPETPAAIVAVAVNPAPLAQEPAPVDRNDEPIFASAASAVEQAAEDKAERETEEKIAAKPVEAVATSEAAEASAPVEAVAAQEESKGEEPKPEEPKTQELRAENFQTENSGTEDFRSEDFRTEDLRTQDLPAEQAALPVPVAESVTETAEPEEPAPSDEELAEALRLLTPSTSHSDVSAAPSHGALVAAGQLLAEEAARNAAAGPRWMAEAVALSPEEAAISLEAEMFRTFAAEPAASTATPGSEIELTPLTGVSAIAAAIEDRLAAAELDASAKAGPEQQEDEQGLSGQRSSEHASDATAPAPVMEAPTEEMAATSNTAAPSVDAIVPEQIESAQVEPAQVEPKQVEPEPIEPEKVAQEKHEAEQKDSPAEEAPAEEAAAATFADAVGKDEVEAAAAEENQDSSLDSRGQESMGDMKAKSGKSNWHQIHTASAGAAANADVETAKQQAEHAPEAPPKAMAAAAAAQGPASVSATDASTIASIVDSVMADLRPRIVEEIARKLAGK